MKNYLLLALLFIISACGGGASRTDDNSTVQKLGETVFSALAENDPGLLSKHTFIDRNDVLTYYTKFWDRGELTGGHLKGVDRMSNARPQVIESLSRVRDAFERKGLTNWSDFNIDNVKYSETTKGAKMARNIEISFTNGDYTGVVIVETFAEMERGWVVIDPIKMQYYGKNFFGK